MIYGFRLVTGRTPNADELSVLLTGYGQDLQAFRAEPERAIQLLRNGDSGIPEDVDLAELAAWTVTGTCC